LNNNTVVTTVMSNLGLYKAFDELGINYEQTAVGDRFVYENMRENRHILGGEQSGHIIFGKYASTGDGMITAIKVLQVMLDRKEKLSALTKPLAIYPQVLKNVRVLDKDAALTDPDVVSEAERVSALLGNDGRLLLRKSGTEPLVRVMVEASSEEACEKYTQMVVDVLIKKGHTV
ncbi:MAG: phosphoglucosamine mutase, partial [Oscillospiraceae bacterium]|nr:phosphoglucosamine mutase [Oscillospiraceae bacterium]